MQTYTQLPGNKAGWLRVAMTIVLLSASLPLMTACNPFSKTTTAAAVPACQTNNTADVRFYGGSLTGLTNTIVWDGSVVATVAPGQYSSYTAQTAGVTHTLTIKNAATGAAVCATSYPNLAQCTSHTFYCTT